METLFRPRRHDRENEPRGSPRLNPGVRAGCAGRKAEHVRHRRPEIVGGKACQYTTLIAMNDIVHWLGDLLGHWQHWASGGGLGGAAILVINLIERLRERTMPKRWYALVFIV